MNQDPPPPSYDGAVGYPPQAGYPPQGGAYPPQGGAYPPQGGAYPPQGGAYPPQGGAYPPQGGAYPPQGGYPPQAGYPPQGGYPQPVPGDYPAQQPYGGGYEPKRQTSTISIPDDHDDGLVRRGNRGLSDRSVRQAFVRKVYLILCMQFSVTMAVIMAMKYTVGKNIRDPTEEGQALRSKIFITMWVCLAVFFITEIVLVCCDSLRRKHPTNLILLAVFTLGMSGFVGCVTLYYSIEAILIAMGSTCIITLGLTLFAMQTKFDITGKGGYIFVIFLCFFCFGFFAMFFHSRIMQVVYGCLGVLVFSLFLVYDTQLLLGGRKYELTEEEYVFAALTIYIDVIQIFLYILSLFGNE